VKRAELVPLGLLAAAMIAGGMLSPHFWDLRYLLDSTSLHVETGLLVIGMTFVIALGQIDLSAASNLALVSCATAKLLQMGVHPAVGICIGIGLGTMLGIVNGLLVAYANLPSFLVTLGTLALYRGIAQALMGAASVKFPESLCGIDRWYLPGGIVPVPFAVFVVLAAAFGVALAKTTFGRRVIAIGANSTASEYSAIKVNRIVLSVFALSGLMAGIAGVMMDSRLGVARYDHARGLELEVITATVLGGTSIYGGKATMTGSFLALLLMAAVHVSLGLANVKTEIQLTIIGAVLVLTLAIGGVFSGAKAGGLAGRAE